jgi:hypothetical protein
LAQNLAWKAHFGAEKVHLRGENDRMARANRHHIPRRVLHITHRCHKREFLLKLVKDRGRWLHWLFEAKKRYGLINRPKLIECCELGSEAQLRAAHPEWVEAAINKGDQSRRPEWTESVALASEAFVSGVLEKLKRQGTGRQVRDAGDHYELREPEAAYNVDSGDEMDRLRLANEYFWAGNGSESNG